MRTLETHKGPRANIFAVTKAAVRFRQRVLFLRLHPIFELSLIMCSSVCKYVSVSLRAHRGHLSGPLGAGVTGAVEQSVQVSVLLWVLGWSPGLLEEPCVLLTAKSFLQPQLVHFF